MIDLETTIEIARPPTEVFAFVAEQTNAPQWQTGLEEVRRLTEGPLGVGTEHEFVRRFAGREIASRNRFVSFDPDRAVEFDIPGGWLTGRGSYRADPSEAGTILTSRMQFRAHGPARLLEPLLTRLLARDSRRDEARLKRILEGGKPID